MDIASTPNASLPPEAPLGTSRRWGLWATLVWSAVLGAAMALFQTLGAFLFLKYWNAVHPFEPIARGDLASHGGLLGFALLFSAVPVLGLLGVAARLSGHRIGAYLALDWPRRRDFGWGVGLLAATLVGAGVLAGLTGQTPPDFMVDTFRTARAANMIPLFVVSFVLLAPLQEELLFRGFLFRGLTTGIGTWPAILATAALWSITHAQYQWFFVGEIFVLGIVLGWLRARSGSTLLTMILHAAVNGLALVEAGIMANE